MRGRFGYGFVNDADAADERAGPRPGRAGSKTRWSRPRSRRRSPTPRRGCAEIAARDGADAIAFLGGEKLGLEEQYLLQKLARAVLGTNHVDSRTRLVAPLPGTAFLKATGGGRPLISLDELGRTKEVLVLGDDLQGESPFAAGRADPRAAPAGRAPDGRAPAAREAGAGPVRRRVAGPRARQRTRAPERAHARGTRPGRSGGAARRGRGRAPGAQERARGVDARAGGAGDGRAGGGDRRGGPAAARGAEPGDRSSAAPAPSTRRRPPCCRRSRTWAGRPARSRPSARACSTRAHRATRRARSTWASRPTCCRATCRWPTRPRARRSSSSGTRSSARAGPDRARDPRGRGGGPGEGALDRGRRVAEERPRPRARGAGAGACRTGDRERSVPDRDRAPRARGVPGRLLRREGGRGRQLRAAAPAHRALTRRRGAGRRATGRSSRRSRARWGRPGPIARTRTSSARSRAWCPATRASPGPRCCRSDRSGRARPRGSQRRCDRRPTSGPRPARASGCSRAAVLFQQGSLGHRIELLTRLAGAATARLHPDELQRLGLAAGDTVQLEGPGGSLTLPAAVDESVPPGAVFVPYAHRDVELNRLGSSSGRGSAREGAQGRRRRADGSMNGMIAFFQDPTVQIAFWGLVKIIVILFVMLGIVAYLTFFERKIAGHIQSRPGPNLVGPWGSSSRSPTSSSSSSRRSSSRPARTRSSSTSPRSWRSPRRSPRSRWCRSGPTSSSPT